MIHLIADVLDEQLQDVDGESAGRIDGIVLELRDGRPPRIAYLEVSPVTLLARFSVPLATWYARFDRKLGVGRGVPFRILSVGQLSVRRPKACSTLAFSAGAPGSVVISPRRP